MADATPFFRLWDIDEAAQQKTIAIMSRDRDDAGRAASTPWTTSACTSSSLDTGRALRALQLHGVPRQRFPGRADRSGGGVGADPHSQADHAAGRRRPIQRRLRHARRRHDPRVREERRRPRPNTRVEKIMCRGRRRHRRTDAKGTFKAPVVVSSAGIQPTVLKLVGAAALRPQLRELHQGAGAGLGLHEHPLLPEQARHGRAHVRRLLGRQLVEHGALPPREGRPDSRRGHPLHVQPFLLRRGGGAAGQAGAGVRHDLLAESRSRRRSKRCGSRWTSRWSGSSRRSGKPPSARVRRAARHQQPDARQRVARPGRRVRRARPDRRPVRQR